MSVTAAQLSKTGARGKDLDVIVREQLTLIDDKLLKSDRIWGKNVIAYNAPTSFRLPGLNKKDAQRIVYAAILKSLIERFGKDNVRICLSEQPERATIYVTWMTDIDQAEVNAMNQLIRSMRLSPSDVDAWLAAGGRPADRHGEGGTAGARALPSTQARPAAGRAADRDSMTEAEKALLK